MSSPGRLDEARNTPDGAMAHGGDGSTHVAKDVTEGGQRQQQHRQQHLEAARRFDDTERAEHPRDTHHPQHAHDGGVGAEGGGEEGDRPVGDGDEDHREVEDVPAVLGRYMQWKWVGSRGW